MEGRYETKETTSEIAFLNRCYNESIGEYNQLKQYYEAGMREICSRLETIDRDYQMQRKHSPIHHIQARVKSLPSALRKLYKLGLNVNMTSAKKNLYDMAGVRVVCCFTEDIRTIEELLRAQDDLNIIEVKDYIKEPKPNGYRSLHLAIDVPIYMVKGKVYVKVEIQIRTVAMDFWATLEHGIRYKSSETVPSHIVDELKECADVIAQTDERMERISRDLRDLNDAPDEYAWQAEIERSLLGYVEKSI